MKEELRPCIIKMRKEENTPGTMHGGCCTRVATEFEEHKGYFHTWGSEAYVTNGYLVGIAAGRVSTLYGVVEYEDGTVHRVPPECITFTDRCRKDVENHSSKCYDEKGEYCIRRCSSDDFKKNILAPEEVAEIIDENAMAFRFGEDNVLRIEFGTGASRITALKAIFRVKRLIENIYGISL